MTVPDSLGPGQYDIDCGAKRSVATAMAASPVRYSIMRSSAARFMDYSNDTPSHVYQTDTAHKQNISSHARDNRRFYASSFQSTALRLRPWTCPHAADVAYDVDSVQNMRPATVSKSLHTTGQTYAILRSRYPRIAESLPTQGADKVYDTDRGGKQTMYTAMLHSPLKYSVVGDQPQEPEAFRKIPRKHEPHKDLGPGSYDYQRPQDVRVSQTLDCRPLSSMNSKTPRFGRPDASTALALGTTWTPEKDQKSWSKRSVSFTKADYLRPVYLPKSYGKQEHVP